LSNGECPQENIKPLYSINVVLQTHIHKVFIHIVNTCYHSPLTLLRFKDPQHHQFLLEFLKSVSKGYVQQERARDFVLDLLALDVSDLFQMEEEAADESTVSVHSDIFACCVSDEFTAFLTDFVQRNQLQEALLEETDKIWVGLVE